MPNFEEFDRTQRVPYQKAKTVTVTRRGVLNFSSSAMEALGNPEAVAYLVDLDERLLGFRSAKRAARNAYTVQTPGHSTQGNSVLGRLSADLSETRRYPLVEVGGTYCIDLKEPGEVVASRRAATGRTA